MFRVPTVPTNCPKGSPKAISWMVNIFHSFKAHLQLSVLINGNIPIPILHTYQSNMVLHLRTQLHVHPPTTIDNVLQPPKYSTTITTPTLKEAVLYSPATQPPPTPTQTPIDSAASELAATKALHAFAIG
ncbi:hypothetical protein BU15DRAFT_63721 [Melanogaster broomeanus]|nr:hypothetical protein BU15DRAFT_63721 [Melanogaster broomeanus]